MEHTYNSHVQWTGNRGAGTASYHAYDRTWDVAVPGKAVIHCSNDPLLGGDTTKMNPEDLILSALSACHMLWFLHYASDTEIIVTSYEDTPVGVGEVSAGGAGRFIAAVLHPKIRLQSGADIAAATAIHHRIHEVCFIARSVNFPVTYEPIFEIDG